MKIGRAKPIGSPSAMDEDSRVTEEIKCVSSTKGEEKEGNPAFHYGI